MTSVALRGVDAAYQADRPVLSGVSLDVESGERFVLIGPSGCGKSTILRVVAGLLAPTGGDVAFDGRSMLAVPPEKRGVAMVFQEPALVPFRTVSDNVGFGLKLRRVARRERDRRVAEALVSVRLDGFGDRWPGELSGGQRRRVALARALVVGPRLLLLDEPLSGLDPNLRRDLARMITELQRNSGITTVMVTHDRDEAEGMADRIGVVIDGRLRQVGTYRAVAGEPVDDEVARFLGGEPRSVGRDDRADRCDEGEVTR